MTHAELQDWLDRYIAAWRANEAEPIAALFTEDAVYHYTPYGGEDDALRGHAAIVDGWLAEGDEPDSWEARYEPYAIDGDRAVATGWSRYAATDDAPARTFHNVFLLRFAADGRCSEFTELFMLEGGDQ
ncbi:MAG TPA: nuclear transport factor 2 family protein [Patescibacteria group bacterium]|nr:nuclear transport factor 2 family protein [Patescibacteria group bacterium]